MSPLFPSMSSDFYDIAACVNAPTEIFFDEDEEFGQLPRSQRERESRARRKKARRETAKGWCEHCLVRTECLANLGLISPAGVFGGTDAEERRNVGRSRAAGRTPSRTIEERRKKILAEASGPVRGRASAFRILAEGGGILDAMRSANVTYEEARKISAVLRLSDSERSQRPTHPRTRGPLGAWVWSAGRWQPAEYLGDRPEGRILLRLRTASPSTAELFSPEDCFIHPSVPRRTLSRGGAQ